MTANVMKDMNKEKQLLVVASPIKIQEWDLAICTKLQGNVEAVASSSSPETHTPAPPIDNDTPQTQPTRLWHITETKEYNGTPQKMLGKVSAPQKRRQQTPRRQTGPRNRQPTIPLHSWWAK